MTIIILCLITCQLHATLVTQQGHKLTGTVVDTKGEPLIGVNILVKNSSTGAITDVDGKFSIENVASDAEITISYIGYVTQEITVGNRSAINITLVEDAQALEEVVVVGYGSFKKSDLTGAISQVKGDDLVNLPMRSAADALQGKAAGVTVTATSGSPGSVGSIRIRGIGTVNNNNPLYVVDGLPQNDINWLNARDIESIEVLKDASAQAIYGARAANGVILISTKRGESGATYRSSIEFDMNIGFQNIPKRYDMLDAAGFMEYKNRAYANSGRELMEDFATAEKREQILTFLGKNGGRAGTDWWKEVTREGTDAPVQNYNLAFSGGMDKLRYRTSFSYTDMQGILNGSEYQRLTGRINVDNEVTKWLTLSANVSVSYEERRNLDENSAYTGTVFSTATADPITPVYRDNLVDIPDFLYNRIMSGFEPTNPWSRYTGVIYSNKPNTVGQTDRQSLLKGTDLATKGNISGEIKFFPFLTFKSSIAIDLKRNEWGGFVPKYYLDGDEYNNDATASRYRYNTDYWVFDNYLTFNKKFDSHLVNAMVGTSAEKERYEHLAASKRGMVNNDESQQIINAGTKDPGAEGYTSISSLNSYFGRLFYSFNNKYMVTANIRWDGSSRFPKDNRWGVFPSVSTGWNFSEEKFMNTFDWLSQGKLRAAWGEIGNQNIGNAAYLNTFSNSGYYIYGNPYNYSLSGLRNQVGNPDLKWETTRQWDFGLDLAFLGGSLRATIDYFERKTSDMLLELPLPGLLGLPNTPWVNAGSVSNRGFELSVAYDGKLGKEFTYHINGNLSTYRNRIESLGSGKSIPGTGVHLGYFNYTMTEVGKPIGYYYGYQTNGVFQTQQEIDSYINNGSVVMPGAKPGDLKFVDINKDGKIDDDDRTMIGNPHPDFTFGLTLGAEYKGFDFSAFFQGSIGNDVMNIVKYDIYSGTGWYNAPKDILTTFWDGPGSTNKNFGIDADSRMNLQLSDWFIEDGSYVRLKNLQVGYTIPSTLTKKITINNLRVFVAAQNLFTITNYSGLDPEMGNTNPLYMGIDVGYYPQPRTFMFGINMKL
ncbi:MAG: TonB-dependent receptor [Tannerella sp.]|jgi:TonB-linked SusC/RagA family outer membrane protein|nr:TonB-dependent receptor [Tannerella sp.]